MENKRNIIVLADFPPVIGGTTIWYYRVSELLKEKGYNLYTFGGKGIPPEGVNDVTPGKIKGNISRGLSYGKDLLVGLIKQGSVIGKLLLLGIIVPGDYKRIFSYLVLINRVISKLPKELTVVLSAHANMNSLLAYLLCKRRGNYKLVIREHGGGILEFAEKRPKLVSFLVSNADYINCVSQYIVDECVKKGAAPERIKVILSARDIPEMDFSGAKEDIVMFAGFLEPRKDPMTFIRAIKEVKVTLKMSNKYRFAIIGSGSLREEMQDYCNANGLKESVLFTGALPLQQTWDWMKKSKILVLPSIREPSGAVLTEAMAYRCYSIATRVGGIPEIVTTERGSTFKPGDYKELAKCIADFIDDENAYKERINNAYDYVRENYTFKRAAKQIDDICSQII